MRRGPVAFQLTGSLLAIICAVSLAIALGGCVATPAAPGNLPGADLGMFTSLSGVVIPASRTQEDAIVARAIAQHEMLNP